MDIYVYSHFDIIKHMVSKYILHSQIGKWALALIEYFLTYFPWKSVKGQIVADFIVNHSVIESIEGYVIYLYLHALDWIRQISLPSCS